MSKKLDIDHNIKRWMKVFEDYQDGKTLKCPICGKENIIATAQCNPVDLCGFAIFTCDGCNKTGHFCRVKFKHNINNLK